MARRVVLMVSSQEQRLQAWQTAVQRAGYLTLAASTMTRALHFANKVRPALILVDTQLENGGALEFLRKLRETPSLERVAVVLLGADPPRDLEAASRDPHVLIRQVDVEAIGDVLLDVVGGPRPAPRRGTPYN